MDRRTLLKTLGALGTAPAAAWTRPALAQAGYPTRPVRVQVGIAPGGITDFMARIFAQQVGERMGQTFIVENRAGASGTLAASYTARAPADGYTLLATTPTVMVVAPYMIPNLNFSPTQDLTPVCLLGAGPMVLVVNAKLPIHSVAELIAYAQSHPGGLAYASGGNGSAGHLTGALFASKTGLKTIHVPYKGDGEGALDVVSGQVPMMFSVMSVLGPQIKAGTLRALGVASATRLKSFPDIPTLAETGVPGMDSLAWVAVYAPRGTPDNVINALNTAWQSARQSEAVTAQLASVAMDHVSLGKPAELAAFQKSEQDRWGGIIRSAGLATVKS